MSEEIDDYDHYAPPDTLLGLLQRGRGEGAIRAAADPAGAADLVYGCIRREWRWDRQSDHRALYQARLLRDLELPPGPVIELLAADEDTSERATYVLELLAAAGSAEALEALPDGLPEEEESRPPRRLKRPDPFPDRDSASLLDLLRDPQASAGTKGTALFALSLRPPEPALIPLVPDLGAADDTFHLPYLSRAVEPLAERAVPAARVWAASERDWLAGLGLGVLAAHGDGSDVPRLIAGLERDWADRAWCGSERVASGLARFGPAAADAVPVLRRFWLCSPHSYERTAYLEALGAIGASGAAEAYVESLWDCEVATRLLGIANAPDRPHVRERLAYLRDDPMEEPDVREAAAERLGAGRGG
ncbi:hypothetical protein ACIBCA_23240 [Kitasatospora sp. NPDC051170]|uniref:hypothetical protein n=1 Tax=Kitasatospora sp. NPDC051170 TaxID=3364056 RepID=UPI00379AFF14